MLPLHRISHNDSSILAVAVSTTTIFAGTQNHTIAVHDLRTFQHVTDLVGHNGSVLSLNLSPDNRRLFSSSGDSIVKVWCTTSFKCLNVIYSSYDVGDIFSTAYSVKHDTLYLGSQNTSLQWINFSCERPAPNRDSYPTRRPNKFFDSTGPSGRSVLANSSASARPRRPSSSHDTDGILLEIGKDDIIQYAHYSYVFCLILGIYRGQEVLFSGGGDGAINVWSLDERPSQVRSFCQAQGASVICLAQHESMLYAGHSRGTISIWDLETDQLLRRLNAHDADVQSLSISGHCLASVGGTDLKLWNLTGGVELTESSNSHQGTTLCSAIAADSRRLVTGGNDNEVAIWDISGPSTSGLEPTTLTVSENAETSVDAFSSALNKLVSFQSVSGSEQHVEDCRRAASFLKNLASSLGAEALLLPTDHNPIVLIKFSANAPAPNDGEMEKKTPSNKVQNVLYYGHYDVISANAESWTDSPWRLTGRNGYLYGRGVSDNKAPILSALFAAHELLVAQSLAINLTLVIEGEEESGSRGFREAIQTARQAGDIGEIDEVFLSNSYWLDDEVPCLTYGLRGVIHASVTVSNTLPDLHSGVEGGSVREPTIDLVNLLGKLTCDTGAISLPNFYEPVRTVNDEERKFYEEIAKSQLMNTPCRSSRTKKLSSVFKAMSVDNSNTTSVQAQVVEDLMNRWCRPSLTIHKLLVSGPGNSTIIPHSASSNISIRIVPDQDLHTISQTMVAFLKASFEKFQSPNQLAVKIEKSSDWWLSSPTSASFKRLSSLIEKEWSTPPLIIREGGSIPMVRWLEQEFDATAVHFPMGQSSDCAHLVDERLRILNLEKGRNIMKGYFSS